MASGNVSKVKGKILDIPTAPTIGTATAGGESVSIEFTAASKGGPTRSYIAKSNPGNITATGSTSPISVTGLTVGTSYTISVAGVNETGTGEYSSASGSAVPTVATSYESIATTTVGSGGTANITFSSIPSTYTHLQIRGILKSNRTGAVANGWAWLSVNGSQGARYHYIYGNGTDPVVGSGVPATDVGAIIAATGTASGANDMFSGVVIDILDYANTNKNKTLRIFSGANTNASLGYAMLSSYLVNSTSAITSISIGGADSTNLQQYSSLALYGIKGA